MAGCTAKALPGDRLLNAEAQHKRHPDTFEIPAAGARKALQVGDQAKIVSVAKGGAGVRVWAEIDKVSTRGCYTGRADGQTVRFGPRHVIDVARSGAGRSVWPLVAAGVGIFAATLLALRASKP